MQSAALHQLLDHYCKLYTIDTFSFKSRLSNGFTIRRITPANSGRFFIWYISSRK